MAKATTTTADIGLISSVSISANGATAATAVPEGTTLELAVSAPVGVTAVLQASYDAGQNFYDLTPSSLATIDASAAAKSSTVQYYTEEPNIQLRVNATGFTSGSLTFRISGAPRR